MNALFEKLFRLNDHQTTVGKESLAGVISFLSIVYIIAVNSTILSDAGIPLEAGIFATVASAFVGCVIMAFWANAPLILVPGMGINALFTYTMVQSMGLSWQEGLLAVVISGFLFIALAFSRLSAKIVSSIPHSLKEAITVGVGLFLTFIGLQKGKLVVPSENTFVALGDLSDPFVISTLLTLIITIVLFIRNVKGNFLLSMIAGSVLAFLLGVRSGAEKGQSAGSVNDFFSDFGTLSFGAIGDVAF